MDSSDYLVAWGVYVAAGIVFGFLAWRVLRKYLPREVAYLLECILLALMFTPAKVLSDQTIMAPALMVTMLDGLTIGPKAAIRALINLVLTLLVALVTAAVLSVIHRVRLRRTAGANLRSE